MIERNIESTRYSIHINLEQVSDRDDTLANEDRWDERLYIALGTVIGVYNVDYGGHFGHFIFLEVDARLDNEETWLRIEETIKKHKETK